uniref:Uncharacterized protein n=1 Tax=Oryza sativa subsp. japonica TaxID=39947 RepID=Q6K538_ORYSJ|nr:hypothetical protein [Oryza sativa Japonica Group]
MKGSRMRWVKAFTPRSPSFLFMVSLRKRIHNTDLAIMPVVAARKAARQACVTRAPILPDLRIHLPQGC